MLLVKGESIGAARNRGGGNCLGMSCDPVENSIQSVYSQSWPWTVGDCHLTVRQLTVHTVMTVDSWLVTVIWRPNDWPFTPLVMGTELWIGKMGSSNADEENRQEIQSQCTAKNQTYLSILCCHEFVVVSWISLHRVRESEIQDQRDFSWISERQWNCNAFCSNRINNCSSNTRAFNSTHLLQTMCNNGHHFVVVGGVVVFVVVAAVVFCVAWQTDRLTDR